MCLSLAVAVRLHMPNLEHALGRVGWGGGVVVPKKKCVQDSAPGSRVPAEPWLLSSVGADAVGESRRGGDLREGQNTKHQTQIAAFKWAVEFTMKLDYIAIALAIGAGRAPIHLVPRTQKEQEEGRACQYNWGLLT